MGDLDLILSEFKEIKELLKSKPAEQVAVMPEIIDSDTICERLSISDTTLRNWRRKKQIPFISVNGTIRYNWPRVVESLEKKNGKK